MSVCVFESYSETATKLLCIVFLTSISFTPSLRVLWDTWRGCAYSTTVMTRVLYICFASCTANQCTWTTWHIDASKKIRCTKGEKHSYQRFLLHQVVKRGDGVQKHTRRTLHFVWSFSIGEAKACQILCVHEIVYKSLTVLLLLNISFISIIIMLFPYSSTALIPNRYDMYIYSSNWQWHNVCLKCQTATLKKWIMQVTRKKRGVFMFCRSGKQTVTSLVDWEGRGMTKGENMYKEMASVMCASRVCKLYDERS